MRSRPYERYAWLLLLAASLPWLYGPLANLVQGEPLAAGLQFWRNDPANESAADWAQLVAERPDTATVIAGHNRMTAVFALTYGLMFVAVVCTAYRRGERWSWFVSWTYPAALIGYAAVASANRGWAAGEESWAIPSIVVLVGVVVLGLLLPVRTFFGSGTSQRGVAGRAVGT